MRPATNGICRAIFFILSLVLSGCSSLGYYRGLVPKINQEPPIKKRYVVERGSGLKFNSTGGTGDELTIRYPREKILVRISTNWGAATTVSIGPGIIFPLPIIPSPIGIFKAWRKSSPDLFIPKRLKFTIEIYPHGIVFLDLSKISLIDDSSREVGGKWEVVTVYDKGVQQSRMVNQEAVLTIQYRTLCNFELDKPATVAFTSGLFKVDGLSHDNEKIHVPDLIFKKGKGFRIWWLPSFNV